MPRAKKRPQDVKKRHKEDSGIESGLPDISEHSVLASESSSSTLPPNEMTTQESTDISSNQETWRLPQSMREHIVLIVASYMGIWSLRVITRSFVILGVLELVVALLWDMPCILSTIGCKTLKGLNNFYDACKIAELNLKETKEFFLYDILKKSKNDKKLEDSRKNAVGIPTVVIFRMPIVICSVLNICTFYWILHNIDLTEFSLISTSAQANHSSKFLSTLIALLPRIFATVLEAKMFVKSHNKHIDNYWKKMGLEDGKLRGIKIRNPLSIIWYARKS